MRALEYLRSPSRIWAIEEGAWEEMVTIAKGENLTLEAIEASMGKLSNRSAHSYELVDGVAVIPVIGPIVKYGNLFSSISGATSVTKLTRDFNAALENEEVKAILFEIDSPGGEANGINEFAEQIYQARGTKPIEAYVSGQGCSAAYWIASACDKIWKDETAMTGSIGVAAVVKDDEGKDTNEGIKTYKFVSEGSENKRPDLETDEGKKVVMESLNAMAQVFRSKVARNRSNDNVSLTVRDVIEKFNRGGILMGKAAVDVGLADGISSYREVLNNLASKSGDTEENASLEDIQESFMKVENNNAGAGAPEAIDDAAFRALEEQVATLTEQKVQVETQYSEVQAQIEELQASLEGQLKLAAALEKENLTLKATAAAADKNIIPAKKANFIKGYVLAATDDKTNPLEDESRLDNFLGLWEASEGQALLEEELDPENQDISSMHEGTSDDLAELLSNARQYAQKENQKLHAVN